MPCLDVYEVFYAMMCVPFVQNLYIICLLGIFVALSLIGVSDTL